MNRIIILIVIFLFSLIWACKECKKEEITSKIISLDFSIAFDAINSEPFFDKYLFHIHVVDSIISIRTTQNQSKEMVQYANVLGGCDYDVPWPKFINNLDSISVSTNREYNENVSHDITSLLFDRDSKLSISEYPEDYRQGFANRLYKLTEPPTKTDTFDFFFRALDVNGKEFNDTIKNVIIAKE